VVWDEIRKDMHTILVRCMNKVFDVFNCAEVGVDFIEVGDMVPMVRRGFIKRGDPQGVDPKVHEIGEFVDDASDVSS